MTHASDLLELADENHQQVIRVLDSMLLSTTSILNDFYHLMINCMPISKLSINRVPVSIS